MSKDELTLQLVMCVTVLVRKDQSTFLSCLFKEIIIGSNFLGYMTFLTRQQQFGGLQRNNIEK